MVYRGCSQRVKRGSSGRGTRRYRAVSILYQYEIQIGGVGVKETERVWFGFALPSVTKETECALETPRDEM